MKDAARLQSAIEILETQSQGKRPLDQVCHNYFKPRRYIGSKDRQAISEYVYGVMRHRASCDWWALERGISPLLLRPLEAARVRLLTYLWLIEKLPREKFGILFSGEKYAPPKLSDKEKALFEKLPERASLPPWAQGEFPEWLLPYLSRRFGETLQEEMKAFIEQAPLDLRVNLLKTSREEALKALQKAGLEVSETLLSPWGIRSKTRENITQLKAFQEGLIEVQDEGSQLVAHLMKVKPSESVLDLCAGAGGKTLALAATMHNKGKIVATDTAPWRLKRAKERLKRAGVYNVECREIEAASDKWLKRQKGRFDHVLVDAPCSGSGTWRRNPDQKWGLTPKDLKELTALQAKLLQAAASFVKPGGHLVYATCSLLCEENEDIIKAFLASNKDFKALPCGLNGEGYLSLTPTQHHTDGFFAARLEKLPAKNPEEPDEAG